MPAFIKQWTKFGVLLLAAVVCGGVGGWFLRGGGEGSLAPLRQSDLATTSQYTFIDPLLALKNPSTSAPPQFKRLQDTVEHFIDVGVAAGRLKEVSVNFRDMSASVGFVINPDEQYAPASLFKVPTMMSYFKLAEKDPTLLSHRIAYLGEDNNAKETIQSPEQLVVGHSYSVEELIERMIMYSDNNATRMLSDYLNSTGNEDAGNNLVRDLGITQIEYGKDFITVRAFALFFRVLYNATYLTRDSSEQALKILSEADFNDGLRVGVPSSIPIAHKFGEFSLVTKDDVLLERELHDCGIIYYPQHPYLLCVMTKGDNFARLEDMISGISNIVYDFMEEQYQDQE